MHYRIMMTTGDGSEYPDRRGDVMECLSLGALSFCQSVYNIGFSNWLRSIPDIFRKRKIDFIIFDMRYSKLYFQTHRRRF